MANQEDLKVKKVRRIIYKAVASTANLSIIHRESKSHITYLIGSTTSWMLGPDYDYYLVLNFMESAVLHEMMDGLCGRLCPRTI